MHPRLLLIAALALLSLLAAACGDDDATAVGSSDAGLDGRTFLSQAVTVDGHEHPLVEGTSIRLEFTADEVRAHAGCNHLFGTLVSTTNGMLEVGQMGGTEMACDAARHDQDTWLVDLLTSSPTWELDGDHLVIRSGTTTVTLLDRRVADPDRPFEGTLWQVDTIIRGDTAMSVPGDGVAELRFEGGQVTGTTACNEVSGGYRLDGSIVHLDRFVQTDVHCGPELMALEEAVLELSGTSAEIDITAGRLVLTLPDGRGLGLHAVAGHDD